MFGPWPAVMNQLYAEDPIFAKKLDALQKQVVESKISDKEYATKLKQLMEESVIRNKK